jgi:hypothetical protein
MNTSASNIGRDTVEIHTGTAHLISSFIDRVFVVDYRVPFKAPDLTPLTVVAQPEPTPAPVRQLAMTKAAIAAREASRRSREKKKTERREHAPSESAELATA